MLETYDFRVLATCFRLPSAMAFEMRDTLVCRNRDSLRLQSWLRHCLASATCQATSTTVSRWTGFSGHCLHQVPCFLHLPGPSMLPQCLQAVQHVHDQGWLCCQHQDGFAFQYTASKAEWYDRDAPRHFLLSMQDSSQAHTGYQHCNVALLAGLEYSAHMG